MPPVTRARKPLPPAPVQRPAGPVAIIVSQGGGSYGDVAARLSELLGSDDTLLFPFDAASEPDELAAAIAARKPRAAVGVGLPAALFASERLDVPVVFCQVFNYAEHPSLQHTAGGVSVLPAFDAQLAVWRAADPQLRSIGTIVGPGHDDLIGESSAAAERSGLDFAYRVSQSDQETIYQFKRLAATIDGFWLVPDNRILSMRAIREMLDYALSHDVRVVVSTPELLSLGALMSFAPSAFQIADTVFELLDTVARDATPDFHFVSPLHFDVQVNSEVARRFGIEVN
jgi:ABC-type uncharacterized transport system substrate-binding protein